MPTDTRARKPIGPTRRIISGNLQRLVQHHYVGSSNVPRDLAADAQMSLSQAQRLLAGELGPSTDTLDRLAFVFSLLPYQLLIPHLDPANPQVAHGATPTEKGMYKKMGRVSLVGRKVT